MLFCLSGKIFLQVYGVVLLFPVEGKGKIGPTPESDGHGLKFQFEIAMSIESSTVIKRFYKLLFTLKQPQNGGKEEIKEKSATQYYLILQVHYPNLQFHC